jgi:hypothetical protein
MGVMKQMCDRNEQRQCTVPGCMRSRFRMTTYCSHHIERLRANGHPTAERLTTAAELHRVRGIALDIIERNSDHEGIQGALSQITHWITYATGGRGKPGTSGAVHRIGAALRMVGADPKVVLSRIAQVWISADEHRDRATDSRTVDTLVGRYVMTLAGSQKNKWKATLGFSFYECWQWPLGRFLREGLAGILCSITLTAREDRERAEKIRTDQLIPLK